jgi:hypothetical protein
MDFTITSLPKAPAPKATPAAPSTPQTQPTAKSFTITSLPTPPASTATPTAPQQPLEKANIVGGLAGDLTSSEQTFGKAISTIGSGAPAEANDINTKDNASKQLLLQAIHNQTDPAKKQHMLDAYQKIWGGVAPTTAGDINPGFNLTPGEVVGSAVGTGLDALSGGAYGKAAEGAETGKLLIKGAEAAAPVAETATKNALGQAVKDIAAKTAVRSGTGGVTGYGYDVSQNLQNGKTGAAAFTPGTGTAVGTLLPLGIGALETGAAVTKDIAPRFINSLIKPNAASFSYGKDPGRTVAAMGITGNNLEDFANNINAAKNDVGNKIGAIYAAPENAGARINANDTLAKIDTAIADAAKGGKNNQGIVTTLQNVKDALLYDHSTDENGVIGKSGPAKDLSSLTPQQAFDLKSQIAEQTKFTGRPSDDKTVNAVLKNMYGDLKGKLNAAVEGNNPEIKDLNQKYADLTSAELATKNRDAIVQRSNMVSLPVKVGGAAGIITALATGGAAVPAILAGVGAGALDKAMESTAVKSRIASWLGSESPSVVSKLLQQNPGIKTVLYRALPKFAAQIGQPVLPPNTPVQATTP